MKTLKSRRGEDPPGDDAWADVVWEKFRKSRSPVGNLLLNPSVIAGVGNVYRAEILCRTGIHLRTPARQIDRATFDQMWQLTAELLKIGVQHNRIITAGPTSSGEVPARHQASERLNIYERTRCPGCQGPLSTWQQANRTMYACSGCQKF